MKPTWQGYWRGLTMVALAVWATGCIQMQDQLSLNKDGSGSWRYKMVLNPQMTAMMAQAEAGEGGEGVTMGDDNMPAVTREELEKKLAEIEGAKLVSFTKQTKDGSTLVASHVEFTSIEAMMASDLGKTIGWYFSKEGDELVATAAPLMAGSKGDGNMQLGNEFGMAKGMMQGMRINRRLSLPTPPTSGNAQATKENLCAWDFRMGPETTEAQFKTASTVIPEYRTSAAGITFKLPLGSKPEKPMEATNLDLATTEVDGAAITPRATSAKMSRRIDYEKTNMHFGNQPLEITLRVPHPNHESLIGYTGPFYSQAIDDKGTDLRLKKHRFKKPEDVKDIRGSSGFGNQKPGFDIDLDLAEPHRAAETCTIVGHFFLHTPGETKVLTFKNLGNKVGKALENEAGLSIKLESLDEEGIQLKLRGNWMDSIQSVEAFDKAGKKLEQQGSSRGKFGDTANHQYSYAEGVPDRLVMTIAMSINKQKVPFSFKDLKLP